MRVSLCKTCVDNVCVNVQDVWPPVAHGTIVKDFLSDAYEIVKFSMCCTVTEGTIVEDFLSDASQIVKFSMGTMVRDFVKLTRTKSCEGLRKADADEIVKFSMDCTRCTAEPWMGSGANPMTRNKVDELLGGECSDHQDEENKDMT